MTTLEHGTVGIIGGTGKTGQRVMGHLRARGVAARPLSRRTAIAFDWTDRQTWPAALEGLDALYVAVAELEIDPLEPVRALAKAAVDAGVRRLALVSSRSLDQPEAQEWIAMEDAVRAPGLETTILRPTWFDQNFSEGMFLPALRRGVLRLPPGDYRDPFIDAGDIAEVAVTVLVDGGYADRVLELSGPRVLSFRAATEIISAASGRRFDYVEVSEDEFAVELTADGFTAADVAYALQILGLIRGERSDRISDGVQEVLGRAPRDFDVYAAEVAAAGGWEQLLPAAVRSEARDLVPELAG